MTPVTSRSRGWSWLLLLALSLSCQPADKAKKAGPSSASASAAPSPAPSSDPGKPSAKEARALLATPVPQAEIDRVVNPKGLAPYAGPTGTVRGVVRIKGDMPVPHTDVLARIARDCTPAKDMFGKTPREGAGRTAADVLVAVTGYQGVVLQKEATRIVRGVGCAWETRTIALTFGQTLRIAAADNRAYVPDLMGQLMPAQLFAMPGAEPVNLPPRKPGRFRLVDSMRLYSTADVFVLAYPTFDVTDVDGTFEITGIPVGKVKLSALLPATMAVSERDVEISADQPAIVDLSLDFDAETFKALDAPLK